MLPGLSFLFGIVEGDVATFGGADADSVFYGDNEDTSVTDFSGLCGFDDSLYCLFCVFVAYYDRDEDSLDGTGVVQYTTINAGLSGLSDASYIIVREPFDIRFEECVFCLLYTSPSPRDA